MSRDSEHAVADQLEKLRNTIDTLGRTLVRVSDNLAAVVEEMSKQRRGVRRP